MKKLTAFILLVLLFIPLITGCSVKDKNGNETKAKTILKKAVENFGNVDSYIQAKYDVNWVTEKDVETKVYYDVFTIGEDGYIEGLKAESANNIMTLGYPLIIKDSSIIGENKPSLIMETFYDKESEKYFHNETLYFQGEFQQYLNYEVNYTPVNILKDDMLSLLNASNNDKIGEDIVFGAYTGGYFYPKVFPKVLHNLVVEDTLTENGKEFFILKGEIQSTIQDDPFGIFDKAEVTFWIDKKELLICKEIYKAMDGKEYKLGEDTIVFEYSRFNSVNIPDDFYQKEIEEKIHYFEDTFKY